MDLHIFQTQMKDPCLLRSYSLMIYVSSNKNRQAAVRQAGSGRPTGTESNRVQRLGHEPAGAGGTYEHCVMTKTKDHFSGSEGLGAELCFSDSNVNTRTTAKPPEYDVTWLNQGITIHTRHSPLPAIYVFQVRLQWPLWLILHSRQVMSLSLRPHGLQLARLPCPLPSPRICSNSCPLSQWCHPTILFCHPLLLLPSIFSNIKVFSNELALHIRWPNYWSFSFSPSNS